MLHNTLIDQRVGTVTIKQGNDVMSHPKISAYYRLKK